MKQKVTKAIALFLLGFGLTKVNAQQANTAAGGDGSGAGGKISYSVGQVVYTSNSGTNGSVSQGVQQSYVITDVSNNEDKKISLNMQVFPNPTANYLQLIVENEKMNDLTYQLFDTNGKLIEDKKITNEIETIVMKSLPSATYFLKVVNGNTEVKTFKIIKTQSN